MQFNVSIKNIRTKREINFIADAVRFTPPGKILHIVSEEFGNVATQLIDDDVMYISPIDEKSTV